MPGKKHFEIMDEIEGGTNFAGIYFNNNLPSGKLLTNCTSLLKQILLPKLKEVKMKALLFLIATSLGGCTMEKQVQVKMVDVELVKVETVFRQPNQQEKILTWQDENNIQYVSYEPATSIVNIGSRMKMLIRR